MKNVYLLMVSLFLFELFLYERKLIRNLLKINESWCVIAHRVYGNSKEFYSFRDHIKQNRIENRHGQKYQLSRTSISILCTNIYHIVNTYTYKCIIVLSRRCENIGIFNTHIRKGNGVFLRSIKNGAFRCNVPSYKMILGENL